MRSNRGGDAERFGEDEEDEESDADDFIVDDDGRPITETKKKTRRIFNDAHLQEGQDIFGVDFDYDEFDKYEEDDYEDESEVEDEYEEEGVDGVEREKRPKKATKKKSSKKSIFEIYEPSELKRGHFTDMDNEIRKTDIPERMQLRDVPLTPVPEGSNELEEEAEWIYKQAFVKPSISNQEATGPDGHERSRKSSSAIGKIKQALDFMRNQQLEVPFIAFYRKEYVQPELNINDLWKVYNFDSKWCQLASRRKTLTIMFEKMRNYQLDKIMSKPDNALPDDIRIMKEDDIDRLRHVQSPEELKDVHSHFLLHYTHEIPAMNEAFKLKEREERKAARRAARRKALEDADENGEAPDDIGIDDDEDDEPPDEPDDALKIARDSGPYAMCRKAGILGIAKRFGLTPEQFAENLRDNYQRHDVDQESTDLNELAKEYVSNKFTTTDEVLHAAKFVVARQIARDPSLRKSVREIFYERAKISVQPTKQGLKEIDENHSCFGLKYLRNKPVRDLVGEQFLKLCIAEEDKLLTISISEKIEGSTSNTSYLDEVKALYQRDEFSKNVQEWNTLRASCVEIALTKMVLPDLRKELKSILLNEAKQSVLQQCCKKLYNWIKIAPYAVDFSEEDDYEWDSSKGIRVMGLAYVPDYSQAAFGALIAPDGDVTDYLRLPDILKRKTSYRSDEKAAKEADLLALKNFIRSKKPHVIAIGGESREAIMIQQDIKEVIQQLGDDEQFPNVNVEIIDNELAKIYAQSKKGVADFREYPVVLRQAVSIARRTQDPLIEYSQLCAADEEILCLRYHSLQDQLPKEQLLENLYLEFINRTNEVGVDINLAVQNSHTLNLVQFICGLGPRKGQALIKILKQTNQRLENRTQLVTACHMGPKVFINCSGFIKIDTNSLGDSTETYVEVLDGSRVHPETYEWARKMAVDALEYDDEEANPAGALEEILESPERLKDLDLDAFAVELERQGFGNKSITLYDIRAELNSRYKDLRSRFSTASPDVLFDTLTKESAESFYVGKMVLATVSGISHRKPQGDQLDQANPVRNDETGLWQCPFCLTNDFPELSEVWNHFDAGECPGQATGVKLRLDNGLNGFIHIKNLSDKHVKNPEERVQIGQTIHVRITKIDVERFQVDCSSKSSDLCDRNNEWRPKKDEYYDQDAEDKELRKDDDAKTKQTRQQYTKRIIVHPAFHNKSYTEAVKIMATMEQGEVIVRPSSKGADHLTCTWKVAPDIYQHIDVREEGKENAFSLGQSLWIGNEEFEDLDEIIARHVTPMASFARDLLAYKYYRNSEGGMKDKMEEFLKEEKKKNANKIHYFLSASKNYPGKFLLSYLPKGKIRHEYCTVTPEGIRFRQQVFDSIHTFLKWFKEHFRDPLPSATPIATPKGASSSSRNSYATPALSHSSLGSDAIHKVAQNMPSHMLHSLSQVATSHTPHYSHTPGGYGAYINTPYTPSGQTPFMTPYQTPHHSSSSAHQQQTPRYGQATPSISGGPFLQPGAPIGRPPHAPSSHGQPSPQSSYRQSPHMQASPRSQSGGRHDGGGGSSNNRYDGSGNGRYQGGGSGYNRDQRSSSNDRHISSRSENSGGYDNNSRNTSDRYNRSHGNDRRDDRSGGGGQFNKSQGGGGYSKPSIPQPSASQDEENWDDDEADSSATATKQNSAAAPKTSSYNKQPTQDADSINWGLAAEAWATRPKRPTPSNSAANSVSGTPRDGGRNTPRG